jgi:hypothetical protein
MQPSHYRLAYALTPALSRREREDVVRKSQSV